MYGASLSMHLYSMVHIQQTYRYFYIYIQSHYALCNHYSLCTRSVPLQCILVQIRTYYKSLTILSCHIHNIHWNLTKKTACGPVQQSDWPELLGMARANESAQGYQTILSVVSLVAEMVGWKRDYWFMYSIYIVMAVLWSSWHGGAALNQNMGKNAYQPLTDLSSRATKESVVPEITKVFSEDSVLIQGLENARGSKENLAPPIATQSCAHTMSQLNPFRTDCKEWYSKSYRTTPSVVQYVCV